MPASKIDPDDPPPHSYKQQREYERHAAANRAGLLANNHVNLPPVCGYTYVPRKPKRPPANWTGEPTICQRTAGAGTNHNTKGFCDYHEWQARQETNKGITKRNEQAKAMKMAEENRRFFGKPQITDPHTVLLEEIQRSASIVSYYENKLQELRELGLTDQDILTQATFKDGIKPSVWMELFNTERDHLVRTCIAAIKAGVAERKVQIAEQQGRLIAAAMFAFIHDPEMALSPEQIMNAPRLIRKHLMAMPHQNPAALDPAVVLARAPAKVSVLETSGFEEE